MGASWSYVNNFGEAEEIGNIFKIYHLVQIFSEGNQGRFILRGMADLYPLASLEEIINEPSDFR